MIEGVEFKQLITHMDDRGFFREIIRGSDDFFLEGFAQWSHSYMFDNVIKAWHLHKIHSDWWYVCSGVLRVGLVDLREDSPTYKQTMDLLMGDLHPEQVMKVPPMVAHGCKIVQGPVNLFYITDKEWTPDDDYPFPYDDPEIDFDWTKGPTIK